MSGPHTVTCIPDLAYGADPLQALDLYRPDVEHDVPTVAYLHGGGWQVGDKKADAEERLQRLASYGVAVASVNYRLVPAATYPAQLNDAKAAIAWLREHGADHGLDVRRLGVWGASAGGYLASMVGLTNGDEDFAGDADPETCRVDVVVDWFGQSDVVSNATRSWLEKEVLNPPFELAFLGVDDLAASPELARSASPLHHVGPDAPPFLIVHGDRDRITPIGQSAMLHDALSLAGAESTFVTLGGAGHESHSFDRPDHIAMTAAFLLDHLT